MDSGHENKNVTPDSAVVPKIPFRALVVDDEVLYARAVARSLKKGGVECDLAHCVSEALDRSDRYLYDAILLDHKLPDGDGISQIPRLLAGQKEASIIVMTAFEAIPSAIQAIRNGAEDYLVKQTSIQPLVDAVFEIRRRRKVYQRAGRKQDGLTVESAAMSQVSREIEKVAPTSSTVLLTGETGSGKEVAARDIHRKSRREGRPFVAVDCASLPDHLVETILFGHEKGAFTGATQARHGAFFEAGNGTIFLDEVGEMPPDLQTRFLRVIESRTFKRVGSVRELPMEARVIAATNRDLQVEVNNGRFRLDLYQRLSVFPIHLPPLRERGDDIVRLGVQFLQEICECMGVSVKRFSRETEQLLLAYDFPGNIRELKNIVERAVILCDGNVIEPVYLPERVFNSRTDREIDSVNGMFGVAGSGSKGGLNCFSVDFVPGVDNLEGFEERLILSVLEKTGGNKSEAARILGISRFALLRRLEKLNSARKR